jgi:beta-aspartyl-peptidase (threonine type)
MHSLMTIVMLVLAVTLASCAASSSGRGGGGRGAKAVEYAIALHGGAGTIPKDTPAAERDEYLAALRGALEEGRKRLERGEAAVDVVEAVVRIMEDDPKFNAGKGAVFTEDGRHELDASIMDGATLKCGAVGAVRTVKNPVSLARLVMERTPHVFLIGDGAELFADQVGVERVPNTYFDTPKRMEALRKALEERKKEGTKGQRDKGTEGGVEGKRGKERTGGQRDEGTEGVGSERRRTQEKPRGTVGCVALDKNGNLAAATSTGGMTAKRFGRVGDTPVIGAGNYADNRACAVSCTGTGEEFIRHVIAYDITARMLYKGQTLAEATHAAVFETLKPDDGGLIAVSRTGEIAMPFSSEGMFRGAADAGGRFEVEIWGDGGGAARGAAKR